MSLIKTIRSGKIWDFPGGIHPPERKKQTLKIPVSLASLPDELILPLGESINGNRDLLVKVGDSVLKGQPLVKRDLTSLPIHAPTSGKIIAVESRTIPHPSGLAAPCLIMRPDMQDRWHPREPIPSFRSLIGKELVTVIHQAGISGMGGAGFPTARKINSGGERVKILIVNAAECEPYITSDEALMQEHAREIIQGVDIVDHILRPELIIIGIEDNKRASIEALREQTAGKKNIVVRVIPTKYPSGGAKQLIKVLTNLEVPSNGHTADIGQMVMNVSTIHAIKRAIIDDEPLIQRIVTLTGNAFEKPRNVWVRLGTPVQSLMDEFGYKAVTDLPRLIMGGPLTGFSLPHARVPVTKTTNCILAPGKSELPHSDDERACIRCGFCSEACPVSLLPQQLFWHAQAGELDKCEELHLRDCIECGACAYVCPSQIPLVQYYRQAKAEIKSRKIEVSFATRAKRRFQEKGARVKKEREERKRKNPLNKVRIVSSSAGGAHSNCDSSKSSSSTTIAMAIARAKARKAMMKKIEDN